MQIFMTKDVQLDIGREYIILIIVMDQATCVCVCATVAACDFSAVGSSPKHVLYVG